MQKNLLLEGLPVHFQKIFIAPFCLKESPAARSLGRLHMSRTVKFPGSISPTARNNNAITKVFASMGSNSVEGKYRASKTLCKLGFPNNSQQFPSDNPQLIQKSISLNKLAEKNANLNRISTS